MKTQKTNESNRPSEAELNIRRVKLLQPSPRNISNPPGREWIWRNEVLAAIKQPDDCK